MPHHELSHFLDRVVEGFKGFLGDAADSSGHLLADRVRRLGTSPSIHDFGSDVDPAYDIVIGVVDASREPEDNDYTGNAVLSVAMEGRFTSRKGSTEYAEGATQQEIDDIWEKEIDRPLDYSMKLLYWSEYTHLPGMRELPLGGSGRVERVHLIDEFGNVQIDETRIIYRTLWTVKLNYFPLDGRIVQPLPALDHDDWADELREINIDTEVGIEGNPERTVQSRIYTIGN